MKFEYAVYHKLDCIFPICFGLFSMFLLLAALFSLIQTKDPKVKRTSFIALCCCCFLFGIEAIHLLRGGIFLLIENEEDQVQVAGIVEKTIDFNPQIGSRYFSVAPYQNNPLYGDHPWGGGLVINGEKYFLVSYGDTKVGDYVRLTVLPKSHYVLELNKELRKSTGDKKPSPCLHFLSEGDAHVYRNRRII